MRLSHSLLLIAATGIYAQIPTLTVSSATSDNLVTVSTTFTQSGTSDKVTVTPIFTQPQSATGVWDKVTISPTFTAAPSAGTNNPESAPHLPGGGDALKADPSPSEPSNAAVKLLAHPAMLIVAGISAFVL